MSGAAGGPGRRFRLRGELAGQERRFSLPSGEVWIGSARSNDVVLPLRGVSRRHARLFVDAEGAKLEDLDSKNGVAVNGTPVAQARLKAGDEIRFGPALLRLEEVDAEDVELAIAVELPEPAPVSAHTSGFTTSAAGAPASAAALALRSVDGFLARLPASAHGDPAEALAFLLQDLGATGGCIVEWPARNDEPGVLAAHGELPSLAHEGLRELPRQESEGVFSAKLDGNPDLAAAVLIARGSDPLGLVISGDLSGAPDCEPLLRTLVLLLDRSLARVPRAHRRQPARTSGGLVFPPGYVHGVSPQMDALYRQMEPLLAGDLPVLILGETGVGKECLARTLHASSRRSAGPLVAINCAAIPAELLEAELFGIGKGVATGVVERPGKFQLAQGGSLFLDEIGEMPAELQAKLLRALQEKEIHPVGGGVVQVDLRVVAATNSDLARRIEEGRFRRDLYYRIAGFTLHIPPLRARKEDIPQLVEGFIRSFAAEAGKSVRGLTVKALRSLVEYPWPGNVRELEHEVRRLVYVCPEGQAIDSAMLADSILLAHEAEAAEPDAPGAELDLGKQVELLEARLIRLALERSGGNRTLAAKLLGVSRNGLAIKMKRLGTPD